MRLLLVLFIFWPLLELWLLVKVGSSIGALPVIAFVVLSAMAGLAVLRGAGWQAISQARLQLSQRASPVPALVDGFLLAGAGLLLMLPGLLSDVVALLLLIGPLRRLLSRRWGRAAAASMHVHGMRGGAVVEGVVVDGTIEGRGEQPALIEGEYRREP
jgi:UPF0716 protein FxsA